MANSKLTGALHVKYILDLEEYYRKTATTMLLWEKGKIAHLLFLC